MLKACQEMNMWGYKMYVSHELGRIGENIIADYITKLGYKVVERNFACNQGEIYIVYFYLSFVYIHFCYIYSYRMILQFLFVNIIFNRIN